MLSGPLPTPLQAILYLYITLMAAGCVGYFGSVMKDLDVRKCVATVNEVGPCGDTTAYERTHFQIEPTSSTVATHLRTSKSFITEPKYSTQPAIIRVIWIT